MSFDNEKVEIGIVGTGSVVHLLIKTLLNTNVSINLLENKVEEPRSEPEIKLGINPESGQGSSTNIRYHATLATLSRMSAVIITVLSDGPELEKALFANGGIASFVSSANVIVDMSSVSPELIQEISEQLAEKEVSFLDAAIINEEQTEHDAVQMLLIGGDEHLYVRVLPIFQRIAKEVKYLGANGASQFYRQAFAVRAKTT
jgi:3-hydroxyisobutyrate dehydrogenase-like beta-hydroxyacid dehydrogenase